MAGYQTIGAINSYGNGYGNYQYNGQPQVNQYDTNNSTQVATMNSYSTPSNDVVKDKVSEENKKKRMKSALWITGGLLVTGAAAAILFASKGTGNSFWDKIKDGANDCWKGIKDTFSSNGAKKVVEEPVLDTVEMIQKNGKTTLRLPDAVQKIHGKPQNIVSVANDLAIDNVAKGLTDATSKVKTSRMLINDNGVEKLVTLGNSGRICCKVNGKIVNLSDQSEEFQKLVKETVDSIKAKDLGKISSKVKLENVVYDSKIVDGTVGTYISKGRTGATNNGSIGRIVTDRFDVDSDVVRAAKNNNKKLKKAIDEATPEGRHWYGLKIKPEYDSWNIRTATHTPKVKNWPAGAQILIENNKVVGVIENGIRVDKLRFDALQDKYPKAFENVLEKKLDNVVRYLP